MSISGVSSNLRFVFCSRINYRMVVTALALPLMISGCTSMRGYPDRLIEQDVALNEVKPIFTRAVIEECDNKTDKEQQKSCRNRILSAGMIGVDINFSEFEKKLFREKREGSFLTTVATLGLTTAGAMTGTAVLSGIATGIVGGKDAFDKEILLDQAANAIHTQMRALRQTVANRIRYGMTQSFDEYPLDSALIDIEEYYNAGTLLGAFVGITASAGVEVKESEINKNRVAKGEAPMDSPLKSEITPPPTQPVTDANSAGDKVKKGSDRIIPPPSHSVNKFNNEKTPTTEIMKNWMRDDPDGAKRASLKKWLENEEIQITPSIFIRGQQFEKQRGRAIVDLGIQP